MTLFLKTSKSVPPGTVRRSLTAALWDGFFASTMSGLVENFLTPFALAMKASSVQLSLLTSVPPLLGALSQWWVGRLTWVWGGRKIVLIRMVFFQSLALGGLAFLPWAPAQARVPLMIALTVGYVAFGGMAGPVWNSLMTEYLPASKRTGYLGWRSFVIGLFVIGASVAAGFILEAFSKTGPALAGFSVLLAAAGICRWVSGCFIEKMYEPSGSKRMIPSGGFSSFRTETKGSPFWPFLLFAFALIFSTNLSGPYFAVYMLRGLHFSYTTYTLLMTSVTFSMVFMSALWGKKANQVGNLKIVHLCGWLTVVTPVLWLLSKSPLPLFFVQIFSGLIWSGYNLCSVNYILDTVPSHLRTQAVSYFNVFNGVAAFSGALVGGHLLHVLPPFLGFPFLSLLVVSAVLRLTVCLFLLPRVKAARLYPDVSQWDLISSVTGLKTMIGLSRNTLSFVLRWAR